MLPDDNYRAILELSSINLELKSETEQDNLIDSFQGFLNALPSPLQILVRVREMDLAKYLESFTRQLGQEANPVYKAQIKDYSQFVKKLIRSKKVLSRNFYIILPLKSDKGEDFSLVKDRLSLNCDIVSRGLSRLGMQSRRLSSLEILELFYGIYCPEQSKYQTITEKTLQLIKDVYV